VQRKLLLIFWLIPLTAIGQYHLSGKILNLTDKKPIANASVFLSNATAGTKTNDDGTYEITNVRAGQYELVVSIVGYETYRQPLLVNNNITLPEIQLVPKAIALREVSIRPDPNRERNYNLFKDEFLGHSEYARQCKILNPDMVDISYDELSKQLTASSYDFIEIENKALGYKIKYLLTRFIRDYRTGLLFYEGSALFESLPGKKHQQSWEKARLNAYKGSSMHFLRSIIADQVAEEGFKVLRLVRKPDPKYNGLGNKYLETLYTAPLATADFAKLTNNKNLFALEFSDCLYVMHTNGKVIDKDTGFFAGDMTSTVIFEKPDPVFDRNGIFLDPSSIGYDGDWGKSRIAELLPVDYNPQ
jgi:hypothetical protein